jgi:GxxExxY protein
MLLCKEYRGKKRKIKNSFYNKEMTDNLLKGIIGKEMMENEIGTIIVETAIAVHRELGPGLLESVYSLIMEYELKQRGLDVKSEVAIPIIYKNIELDEGFRADLIVEGKVIVELKSVEHVTAAHRKQVQTYLRLTGCKLGYLLNFGEELMKMGITRCVNGLE